MQKVLSAAQLELFNHNHFVEDQVRQFIALVGPGGGHRTVVDMGGGNGFFARLLKSQSDFEVRVVDMDASCVGVCHAYGIVAKQGDALNPEILGDEDIVSFNLILHHLVGLSEKDTRAMQTKALSVWRAHARIIFVNEYIYESYIGHFSGWLIYQITSNAVLSWLARGVAKIMPTLTANTFGVGVRFRDSQEWMRVFEAAGYSVKAVIEGANETVSLPRRLLLIKRYRRDSFMLVPAHDE